MGVKVNIGCAELVYPDTTSALIGVEKYMTDPINKEKEYNKVCVGAVPEQCDPGQDCAVDRR